MNPCETTTRRMLNMIENDPFLHLMLFTAALLPDGDNLDDDMTFAEAGDKVRRAAHQLRREAKQAKTVLRHRFAQVGSLDKVDWPAVAYVVMCSINPLLDKRRAQAEA